jgi:hypothetical protein
MLVDPRKAKKVLNDKGRNLRIVPYMRGQASPRRHQIYNLDLAQRGHSSTSRISLPFLALPFGPPR